MIKCRQYASLPDDGKLRLCTHAQWIASEKFLWSSTYLVLELMFQEWFCLVFFFPRYVQLKNIDRISDRCVVKHKKINYRFSLRLRNGMKKNCLNNSRTCYTCNNSKRKNLQWQNMSFCLINSHENRNKCSRFFELNEFREWVVWMNKYICLLNFFLEWFLWRFGDSDRECLCLLLFHAPSPRLFNWLWCHDLLPFL